MPERNRFNLTPKNAPVISLDLKYPGPIFTKVLKSHGKDGRYLVLVVGPFANLSDDFMVLCDFLGRARALKAINKLEHQPEARVGNEPAYFSIAFWSLGLFGLGRADSGSFSRCGVTRFFSISNWF